jgi:L-aminopeptidase/D-esterase-like protein
MTQGNVGAGCGATIGKLRHGQGAMKSGIGSASIALENGFSVGAIVAVNALGDVYEDGRIIAGMLETEADAAVADATDDDARTPDAADDDAGAFDAADAPEPTFADSCRCLLAMGATSFSAESMPQAGTNTTIGNTTIGNTTIGIIATNGAFTKTQCSKIAAMAHDGLARAIRPIHTTMDGDLLFAISTGDLPESVNVDVAGEMAAIAVERAIIKAVKASAPAGGLPSWQSFHPIPL